MNASGHSLRLTLPNSVCRELNVGLMDEIVIYVVGKTMCVEKAPVGDFFPNVAVIGMAKHDEQGEA